MIPRLYEASERLFESQGIGTLTECTRCDVTEERNGMYEAELDYPITGKLYDQIHPGRLIYTSHDDSEEPQAFEIYKISAPLNGVVTINAQHISYMLNSIVTEPFTANSVVSALEGLVENSVNNNPFLFWTDKTTQGTLNVDVPKSVRSVLGGSSGSILQQFGGGEYEFDMFTVNLYQHRGSDNGVEVRYGKNLKTALQVREQGGATAIVPYYATDDDVIMLPEVVVNAVVPSAETMPIGTEDGAELATAGGEVITAGFRNIKTIAVDMSAYFDGAPSIEQMRAKAVALLAEQPWKIKENITFDLVALWQTEEYKNVAPLERIHLCDIITLDVAPMGIKAKAECIRMVYDSLNQKNKSVEVGEAKRTLAQTVAQVATDTIMPNVPTKTFMQNAIDAQTQLITGGKGGFVKWVYLADGTPSELLFMDEPTEEEATHILRINQNGIGFSDDGGVTYKTAWTLDGRFNASFITTGVLMASLIKAGVLSDEAGLNSWDMTSGELKTKSLECTDYFHVEGASGSMIKIPFDANSFLEISQTNPFVVEINNPTYGWYKRISFTGQAGLTVSDNYTSSISELASTGLYSHDMALNEAHYEAEGFKFDRGTIHHEITAETLVFTTPYGKFEVKADGSATFDNGVVKLTADRTNGLGIYINGTGYNNVGWLDISGHHVLGV